MRNKETANPASAGKTDDCAWKIQRKDASIRERRS